MKLSSLKSVGPEWVYPMQLFSVALVLIAMSVGAACARIDGGNSSTATPGSSLVPTPTATPTDAFIYKIEVTTSFEGTTTTTSWGVCSVPSTLAGAASASGTVYNCPTTFAIPEIELYYSDIQFTITSSASTCKVISFRPYYYQLSTNVAFVTAGGTTIDCSGGVTAPTADCYRGVGIAIIPSFPTNGGIYFLTATGLSKTFTASSANTKRQSGGNFSNINNRWVANDASAATRASGIAGQLVANSLLDYRVVCSDSKDNQYMSTFTITTDVGAFSSGANFQTWP